MAKTTPPATTAAVTPSQLLCSTALCIHSSAIDTVDITPMAEPSRNARLASSGDRLTAMTAPMVVLSPARVARNRGHSAPPDDTSSFILVVWWC